MDHDRCRKTQSDQGRGDVPQKPANRRENPQPELKKDMFVLLTGVSGVGAVTARMMLSSLKPEEVSRAILQSNIKLLESVKGIGKKTAERLVLELKDKMGKQSLDANLSVQLGNSLEQDALNALTALGISRSQAENAIQKIILAEPSVLRLEDLIKKALKAI